MQHKPVFKLHPDRLPVGPPLLKIIIGEKGMWQLMLTTTPP